MAKTVRIGCSSAFWGDTSTAAEQLVTKGNIDYLVADYLAEITMSILALKRMRDPAGGYAEDFVQVLAPLLPAIKAQGIRVAVNAGGLNPAACCAALQAAAEVAGVELTMAHVSGDDLLPQQKAFADCRDLDTGAAMPRGLVTMNAYLGALPIRDAFLQGADIVVTGRCADSALVLGPLMAEFGWSEADFDRLSAGSLAGHIIECGAQCTGGNFTDWQDVPGFDDMGFPIVEVDADGGFEVSKPDGTGGLVSPLSVAEQMVYEIGDPGAYVLPDVVCDWTHVSIEASGPDRVRVSGARGRPPTEHYKVSATYPSGFRTMVSFVVGGFDAPAKGRAAADALFSKVSRLLQDRGLGAFDATAVELIGAEAMYGPHAAAAPREVTVRLVATHANRDALKLFGREIAQAATGMVPACRTLDTISVFALTVSDAWAVFAVAEADAYSRPMPAPVVSPLPPRLRIAVPTRASLVTDGDDVQAAIFHETPTRLRTTGAEVVELPSTRSPACPTRAPEPPSAPPHSGRASAKSPRRCIRSPGRSSRAGWS